uniref:Uncharacterized protein n=1 Tax=Noccaea caerulescens TaxID=107243 RepID=A0A1J3FZZ2_NOCCA
MKFYRLHTKSSSKIEMSRKYKLENLATIWRKEMRLKLKKRTREKLINLKKPEGASLNIVKHSRSLNASRLQR